MAYFFGDVVARLAADRRARPVVDLVAEHGRHTVWATEHAGRELAFFQPGVGAPLAAGFPDEVIDYGCRTVVAVGSAGALVPELSLGHVVVVAEAMRGEGPRTPTSRRRGRSPPTHRWCRSSRRSCPRRVWRRL
ncbi:MAG: hypothetical protein ACRD0B_04385 [Acidimicrobiales bacterium]